MRRKNPWFSACLFAVLIGSVPAAGQTVYATEGASCTGVAAVGIGGSSTNPTAVVSPAAGNNLVCIGGSWQYPAYQFGSTSASCAPSSAGAIQWTGSAFQGCNGTSWTNLALGGSGTTLGTSATATNPQVSGDATTGFFSTTASTVSLAVGGTEAMRVNSSGVGLGGITIGGGTISFAKGQQILWSDANDSILVSDGPSYFSTGTNNVMAFNTYYGVWVFRESAGGNIGMSVWYNGTVGIGTLYPQAALDINGASIIIEQSTTPADNAACTAGTIWWDANYIYVCTASGTVKRAALNGF